MTLPNQPSIDQSTLRSQEIFRIKKTLSSPGDIVEIDAGARAIFIGPDSDIAEVELQYYDPYPTNGNYTAVVSPNGPWVGPLFANLTEVYPSGQPQRILASALDIVDPNYTRPTVNPSIPARQFNLPVFMDLIVAMKDLPQLPQVRADRTIRLAQVPMDNAGVLPSNGSTDLIIPIYGRRLISIDMAIPAFVGTIVDFYMATVIQGASLSPHFIGGITQAAVSVSGSRQVVIRASRDESSVEATVIPETYVTEPIFGPVGQADLLIINLLPNYIGPPPAGTSFIDISVRVSDREA